ncbi:ATP-binding protein [Petrachloros mirabilis]
MAIQHADARQVSAGIPASGEVPSPSAELAVPETYESWLAPFAAERLRVLYYLGLAANVAFMLADFLLYREYVPALLPFRVTIETGFLVILFALYRGVGYSWPALPLAAWVLIGNLCIAQMTVILGGFTSPYFNGLNLVFLAAAVIVPISWSSHLVAQTVTLLYYYGANLLRPLTPVDVNAAISNSFFLVWTSVACLFSVFLYERVQRRVFEAQAAERRARNELELSNEKLRELDRLKSEFFANISHELRTPLTVSLGAFRTLLNAPLTKESQVVVQSGLRNTSRLLFLINELLELAKFESGEPALKAVCIDFAALIRTVAANFELSERQRVFIECPPDPLPVVVDVRRMTKVVYNLLSNAFKFSDPQEGKVWIRIRPDSDRVVLEIQDRGIGIAEDQHDRIFGRFYQVEGHATRRFEGSGIGLALAKEIVTLHGGKISVQSTLGEGSTFTVVLPRGDLGAHPVVAVDEEDFGALPLANPDMPEEVNGGVASTAGTDRPQVLVVDDNPDMRAYLSRLLSDEYRVVTACDGVEALKKAQKIKPALILADMMMPVMSGYDLLKAIHSDQGLAVIPFIMLTARAGTEARSESFEAGADDYISKPFHEEELFARVKNQLRIRQQERELQARTAQLEHLYSQLEAANAELRELSNRKSEFVSIVSHDLRTPLTAVTSFLDNLLEGMAGPLTDKQELYVRRIQSNIWRLIRMVTDLLDLAKIESGNVHLNPQRIALQGFVANLVENLQPVAQEKSLRLHAVMKGSNVCVQADSDKLTQVLTNLVHNACKFTPAGGEVRVELIDLDDGFIRICVADTGPGISAEELPHIFQRFFSGKTSSREVRGAGLGLAIAKHFVELHGGGIWAESTSGEGSRFFFTIPLKQESQT